MDGLRAVTGIRSDILDQGINSVVITASYNSGGGNTVVAVDQGSLAGATTGNAARFIRPSPVALTAGRCVPGVVRRA